MPPDPDLLRRYADDRDETAFTELVQRHLGLVHATALRLVNGDRHLAQDVAQTVFTELARQSRALAGRATLVGWLHTTARFLASKAARAERRRREREQKAHAMNEIDTTPDAAWQRFAPVLDDAVAALDAADRDALLLRFFSDQSHREVGDQLGLTEDAARMRIARALDKLREHFSKRGVTTTAALLSLTLGVHGSTPAPAGLAASVAAKSIAAAALGASAAGGLTAWLRALLATKTRIALVTAGVAGLAVFFFWQRTHGIPLTPDSPYPLPPPSLATAATNQLGWELYRRFAATKPGENILLSPFSIQNALAMTYAGADGETRAEMARVLHYPADDVPLAASFSELRDAIDADAQFSVTEATNAIVSGDIPSDTMEWRMANRLFGPSACVFLDPFLAFVEDNYGAPLERTDFHNPEPARMKINNWVEQLTNQKIRNLIPAGGLNARTRLVLVNALYLKAPWQAQFEISRTEARPFRVNGKAPINVPTMQKTSNYFGYAKRAGYTALTLPYHGGGLQFLILLPDDRAGVDALAGAVTPEMLHRFANLAGTEGGVELYLPKFRLEAPTILLKELLSALGMITAFDEVRANFGRMALRQSSDDNLFISEAYHKTFLDLDEKGTEAAAATAVVIRMVGGLGPRTEPPPPIVVRVDRPFIFAIQHRASGACLFLGRVIDPR